MNEREGFLHAFGLCKFNLQLVGLWPEPTMTKSREFITNFHSTVTLLIIVIFVNISQTTKLFMVWGDLDTMTDIISTANLPIAIAVFKMIIFLNHRTELSSLLLFIKRDWKRVKNSQQLEHMQVNAAKAKKISLICAVLGLSTVNGHLAIRIGQEFQIIPGQVDTRLPFVNSFIPYYYKNSPVYEITWIIQYTGTLLATFAYSGIYCLFVALVLHLCGQFAILNCDLTEVVRQEEKSFGFHTKLSEIVVQHDKLNRCHFNSIRFAHVIERIFNLMFLAEIFGCTVQFCMQGFLLVTLSSKEGMGFPILNLLFMSVYVMHIGTHLFICCYVAEKLQDESSSIFQAAYNCSWYNLSSSDASELIIIMQRSKKPLQITAGKFCVFSLSLYAQIFKTSGGYLSMLLAVKDRIS